MKTAMMQMIDWLDTLQVDYHELPTSSVLDYANELFEKEKQQIIDAYDCGKEQPSKSQLCPNDYYNETFKQ